MNTKSAAAPTPAGSGRDQHDRRRRLRLPLGGDGAGGLPEGRAATVVLVEADAAALSSHSESLYRDGFDVLPAASPKEALALFRTLDPQILVLDVALPEGRGAEFLRHIRVDDMALNGKIDPGVPVIAICPLDDPPRRFQPDLGADDYLRRPFLYEDLRRHISAVLDLRRQAEPQRITVGGLRLDIATRRAAAGDREVRLSKKEFSLVRLLGSDPSRTFTKAEIAEGVWGEGDEAAIHRLESLITRLRLKLDPEGQRYVVNSYGVGYRLVTG
jgi:DNA-binding response OmpR family regulator